VAVEVHGMVVAGSVHNNEPNGRDVAGVLIDVPVSREAIIAELGLQENRVVVVDVGGHVV